jgi:hypothetical protein
MTKSAFLGGIPMNAEELRYEERIRQLEENIANLRMSRRILMNLLEQVQYSRKEELMTGGNTACRLFFRAGIRKTDVPAWLIIYGLPCGLWRVIIGYNFLGGYVPL